MPFNFHKFLRKFDAYAKPVTFTYRGTLGYRTAFGGCLTILFVFFLFAVFIYKLSSIGSYENSIEKKFTYVEQPYLDDSVTNLGKYNFIFGFQLISENGTIISDYAKYGDFKVYQNTLRIITSNNTRDLSKKEIPFARCSADFSSQLDNYEKPEGLDSYNCPSSTEFYL